MKTARGGGRGGVGRRGRVSRGLPLFNGLVFTAPQALRGRVGDSKEGSGGKGELRALCKDASCGEGFLLSAEAEAGRAAMSNVALSRNAPPGIVIFRPD